ncbi:hypothetical protein [Roseateles sp.]|uniref:hypothetical protein n=1 Tax=Roseateles sp. TaxID=1971397 RepID=UPI0039E7DC2E
MSHLKTATTALTAAVLVGGIGLAFAQSDDQNQPAEPMTAATASPTSEQTPADPNALPTADTTTQMPQQMPADDPARTAPPVDTTTTPLPSDTPAASDNSYRTPAPAAEPAPRADRN